MSERRMAWLLPAGAGLALAALAGLALSGANGWLPARSSASVTNGVAISQLEPGRTGTGAPTSSTGLVDVAAAQRLAAFLQRLQPEAELAGVSRTTFDAATRALTPDPDVLALARSQPEFVMPPWDYLARVVTAARIEGGELNLRRNALPLAIIEARSGVDAHVLAAIWGIESNYGSAPGDRPVVRSLATLAANDERRGPFWKSELVHVLLMIEHGDATPAQLVGSWAGAMGHTQFMPSTFASYAVDFDGDGRRDIWGNALDGLASAANYLRASGWQPGVPWGIEVVLPRDFDLAARPPDFRQTAADWAKAGVVPATRPRVSPSSDAQASLLLPAGIDGPAFLVTANFDAILRYNQSTSYALAVGHLADRIGGGLTLTGRWPLDDRPLTRAEREEMQSRLAMLGIDAGGIDGMVGIRTRRALRTYQLTRGLSPDMYVSQRMLDALRAEPIP